MILTLLLVQHVAGHVDVDGWTPASPPPTTSAAATPVFVLGGRQSDFARDPEWEQTDLGFEAA